MEYALIRLVDPILQMVQGQQLILVGGEIQASVADDTSTATLRQMGHQLWRTKGLYEAYVGGSKLIVL